MEIISATRKNLLLKKEELNSASEGAELLRNKRDALLLEFFSTLKSLLVLRDTLKDQANEASRSLIFALGLEGKERLSTASFIKSLPITLKINYKNLLGLAIPEMVVQASNDERGDFGSGQMSPLIEETESKFQDFLNLALRILPQELKLKRLGREIKNTTRKVNSLEKYVIPQLYSQIKFIQEALEEREREDIFRLKRLKKRLGQAK